MKGLYIFMVVVCLVLYLLLIIERMYYKKEKKEIVERENMLTERFIAQIDELIDEYSSSGKKYAEIRRREEQEGVCKRPENDISCAFRGCCS